MEEPMAPAPAISATDTASPVPDLIATITAALGPKPNPSQLAAGLFDIRRCLVESLLQMPAPVDSPLSSPSTQATDEQNAAPNSPDSTSTSTAPIPLTMAQEDILRDALPPLQVPAGPYMPVFSAWRGAVAAVMGLIAGSAVAQGLQISGALAVLCSMAGVCAALWLADYLAHARATGNLQCAGRTLRWKTLRRWGTVAWGAALVLTLMRDFLQQNPALEDILAAFSAFLTQGAALPLLQNMYWLLGFIVLFLVATRRPVCLDMAEYSTRLLMVTQTWWDSALLLRDSLLQQYATTHSAHSPARQKAAQELYSFAAELPSAQSYWLRERLDSLGFTVPSALSELRWNGALSASYDMVGHVTEGDLCFVDTAPLMNGDQVLRKGTVRKIRIQS